MSAADCGPPSIAIHLAAPTSGPQSKTTTTTTTAETNDFGDGRRRLNPLERTSSSSSSLSPSSTSSSSSSAAAASRVAPCNWLHRLLNNRRKRTSRRRQPNDGEEGLTITKGTINNNNNNNKDHENEHEHEDVDEDEEQLEHSGHLRRVKDTYVRLIGRQNYVIFGSSMALLLGSYLVVLEFLATKTKTKSQTQTQASCHDQPQTSSSSSLCRSEVHLLNRREASLVALVALLVPSTLLLIVLLRKLLMKFTKRHGQYTQTTPVLALAASLATLYLVPWMVLLLFPVPSSYAYLRPPLGHSLAAMYLQALLFELVAISSPPSRLVEAIQCLLSLPVFALAMYQLVVTLTSTGGNNSSLETPQLVALCVGWPLLAALAARRLRAVDYLMKRQVLLGANKLIETKVSMEMQRQQQETLLLSVLPAYVAEQVKRNMFKKCQSSSPGAPLTSGNPSSQPQVHMTATTGAMIAASNECVVTTNAIGGCPTSSASGCMVSSRHNSTSVSKSPLPGAGGQHPSLSVFSFGQQSVSTVLVSSQAKSTTNPTTTTATYTSKFQELASGFRRAHNGSTSSVGSHHLHHHHQPWALSMASNSINNSSSQTRRGFNDLFIRTYNNVSLLYGDIVGFTSLCTKLSSSQLVRVLNDLYSHFDYLAERHKIMRIKILGDCYYGVGGIPEFAVTGAKSSSSVKNSSCGNHHHNDNHAINCVNMALDMIAYIQQVHIEAAIQASAAEQQQPEPEVHDHYSDDHHQLELNMRIGIHTGHIHSGVIGLKKWQFDIWSNDVSIAMHCESSGSKGRIQVTEATVHHLNGAFSLEPSDAANKDQLLCENNIKTYFITGRAKLIGAKSFGLAKLNHKSNSNSSNRQRQQQNQSLLWTPSYADNDNIRLNSNTDRPKQQQQPKHQNKPSDSNIRNVTINTIRQTILNGDDSSTCSLNWADINPWTMGFRDSNMSKMYSKGLQAKLQEPSSIRWMLCLLWLLIGPLSLINVCYLRPSRYQVSTSLDIYVYVIYAVYVSLWPVVIYKCSSRVDKPPIRVQHLTVAILMVSMIAVAMDTTRLVYQIRSDLSTSVTQHCELIIRKSIQTTTTNTSYVDNNDQYHEFADSHAKMDLTSGRHEQQSGERLKNMELLSDIVSRKNLLLNQVQLSVILLLIAVDLCNESSLLQLTYKWKCLFIIMVLILNVFGMMILQREDFIMPKSCLNQFNNQVIVYNHNGGGGGSDDDATGTTENRPHQDSDATFDVLDQTSVALSSKLNIVDWCGFAVINVICLLSVLLGRQIEWVQKVSFLWRQRLSVDHEELEYISGINKVLLENILPSHVVQYYLTTKPHNSTESSASRSPSSYVPVRMSFSGQLCNYQNLYHEQHHGVAVMFASIPHFYEFYDESDLSKQGLGCIALLNEIICDFDKLLLKNKFSRIEKIKTIGSTYMAAAGLRPSSTTTTNHNGSPTSNLNHSNMYLHSSYSHCGSARSSNASQFGPSSSDIARCSSLGAHELELPGAASGDHALDPNCNRNALYQQRQNLICIIQFAMNLMNALNSINKQSFQVFKLRVGINTGGVIAGVVGAQRPFYDIWGDTVNTASRMESLGQVDRIQVDEKTARLLMDGLGSDSFNIVRRGQIEVKGKGSMMTYFVDKRCTPGSAAGLHSPSISPAANNDPK